MRVWTMALALCAVAPACQGRLRVPDLAGPYEGVAWPAPPDAPRVRYVGALELPSQGFALPLGVACARDKVAVADARASVVYVLDLSRRRWTVVRPPPGDEPSTPVGVAWLPDGSVVLVDATRRTVSRTDGRSRGKARVLVQGGPLVRPTAVRHLGDDVLLVVDTGGHRLYEVSASDGTVTPVGPDRGAAGEGFNFPVDVAAADDGSLFVADGMNAVVQQLQGEALSTVAGDLGDFGLVRPKGIALDGAGQLHVVDAGLQDVQVYRTDGVFVGRYGGPGPGDGALALPARICIEGQLVFVADSLNRRLQVYALQDEGEV